MRIEVSIYFDVCAATIFVIEVESRLSTTQAMGIWRACHEHLFVEMSENGDFHDALQTTIDAVHEVMMSHSRGEDFYHIMVDANIVSLGFEEVESLLRQDWNENTTLVFGVNQHSVWYIDEGSLDMFMELTSDRTIES